MKFLTSLLLLVATVCFGATPDYKAFRGIGGIVVVSNPPIGTITFDGSGISSPTGGISAATATNIAISIFNQYSSTNGLTERTNVLYIECGDTDFLSKISNCPNNTVMVIGPCPQGYTFGTWAFSSNNTATPFSLVNKTNVEIHGLGMPSFKSSQAPFGETMMISNCSGITIRGIRLESLRVTNIASMPSAFTYPWAALMFLNTEHLLIEECEFINHHDHGIMDGGGYVSSIAGVRLSTNDIVIRNNHFRNIGSYFPTVDSYDGAAISITGGLIDGNNIYECGTGIEPYSSALGTNLFTKITGNYLENMLVAGIQDGGMGLRFYGVEISKNTLRQSIGYTRGGSNILNYSYGIKTTAIGNVKISENTIINQQGEAILLQPGARASSFTVDNNFILNSTNHVGSGTGVGIVLYSVHPLHNSSFRGNMIINSAYGGMAFADLGGSNGCLRDSIIENNTLICPSTVQGPGIALTTSTCSNLMIRGNFIRDTNATPTMWHGIQLGAGLKRIFCYDNIIEGAQTGAGNFQILNEAGDEVSIDGTYPLGPTNVVALVSGRYTNNVWDRLVGIPGATTTIGRTNLLPSAAKYFRWPITIFDKGTNASGTNLWIATVGSQTINGGPTITNIATDNGSMTLVSDGANWRILNVASSGVVGGGNVSSNNAGGITAIGLSTNQTDLHVQGNLVSAGLFDVTFVGDFVLQSDPTGQAVESAVSSLKLGYLNNVTSDIQTQLNTKGNVSSNSTGGITSIGASTNRSDTWFLDDIFVNGGIFDALFLGGKILVSDGSGQILESAYDTGMIDGKVDELNGVATNLTVRTNLTIQGITGGGPGRVRLASTNGNAGVTFEVRVNAGTTNYIIYDSSVWTTGQVWIVHSVVGQVVVMTNGNAGDVNLPGVGFERFYDDAHTEYFQWEAPFDIQTNNVVRALSNATAGVLVIKGVGTGTNQMLAIPEGTGMFTNNGSGVYGWMAIPSGGGVTSLTNLLDVVATNMQSGDALTFLTGMNKWTNVAPFITYNLTINSTNVFVGSNLEHNVYINTNSSFKMVFTGTPLLEETLNISISNYAASTIYITNSFYDTTVASNVLTWAIAPLSERKITLVNMTNHSLGVARWELRNTLGKEYELAVNGNHRLLTNAADSIITIDSLGATNGVNAAAGVVGQVITNFISGVPAAASGTIFDITNVVLTPGDWEISGMEVLDLTGVTYTVFNYPFGVITTPGNALDGVIVGLNYGVMTIPTGGGEFRVGVVPSYPFNTPTNATIYLKARVTYSGGTPILAGSIVARRVR